MNTGKLKLGTLTPEEISQFIPYPDRLVLLGHVGSKSHGTYIPPEDPLSVDDIDILGVTIAPVEVYFGFEEFEQLQMMYTEPARKGRLPNVWDSCVYEIKKFFKLLLKNNPNVLALLYLSDTHYLYKSPVGSMIIDRRKIFSSKIAYHSFTGYAHGQLHRMTHGEKHGLMGKKRKDLVDKFGYDAKNASHLIRLLKMGIEYLTDGRLQVLRPEADMLKSIKRGEWTLEQIKAEADRLFILAEEAFVRSKLPEEPDHEAAQKLLMEILRESICGG
jgi:uncharacterized protein